MLHIFKYHNFQISFVSPTIAFPSSVPSVCVFVCSASVESVRSYAWLTHHSFQRIFNAIGFRVQGFADGFVNGRTGPVPSWINTFFNLTGFKRSNYPFRTGPVLISFHRRFGRLEERGNPGAFYENTEGKVRRKNATSVWETILRGSHVCKNERCWDSINLSIK